MNRELSRFCKEQYEYFSQSLINQWAVDQKHVKKFEAQLKPIFKRYLSLSCAATVIGHRAKRNDYIEVVVEVSLLCMILAIKGLENPSCVLLRQSIELVLKHIYFSTHPVEYEWSQSRIGYRELTFQKLHEYICRTEEFIKLDRDHDLYNRLLDKFNLLSRHVHVHNKGFMGYCKVGSVYRPTNRSIKKLGEYTKEVWPILTSFLVVHFPIRYQKSNEIEKNLIRSGLPKNIRDKVNKYFSNIE